MGFTIEILSALTDNYVYLVSDAELGLAMVVDPGDAEVALKVLRAKDLHLALILNTHHHKDHIAGNAKLQHEFGAPIIGPSKEQNRIEGLARGVEKGDIVSFSNLRGQVIETPGHTSGHIAFYFPEIKALFSGDALYSLGCGKLFEGTTAEMWGSLTALRSLPDDTLLYCGHEYTEANAEFAIRLDKNNEDLKVRMDEVMHLRLKGKPTVPVTLEREKKTNPFLRVDDPAFQRVLAKSGFPTDGTDPAAIFGALRAAKDRFSAY